LPNYFAKLLWPRVACRCCEFCYTSSRPTGANSSRRHRFFNLSIETTYSYCMTTIPSRCPEKMTLQFLGRMEYTESGLFATNDFVAWASDGQSVSLSCGRLFLLIRQMAPLDAAITALLLRTTFAGCFFLKFMISFYHCTLHNTLQSSRLNPGDFGRHLLNSQHIREM